MQVYWYSLHPDQQPEIMILLPSHSPSVRSVARNGGNSPLEWGECELCRMLITSITADSWHYDAFVCLLYKHGSTAIRFHRIHAEAVWVLIVFIRAVLSEQSIKSQHIVGAASYFAAGCADYL